jgi:hypothetical protein
MTCTVTQQRYLMPVAVVLMAFAAFAHADEAAPVSADDPEGVKSLLQARARLETRVAELEAKIAELEAENRRLEAQFAESAAAAIAAPTPAAEPQPTIADTTDAATADEIEKLKDENRRLMMLAGITPSEDRADDEAAAITTTTDPTTGASTVESRMIALPVERGDRSDHWMHLVMTDPDGPGPTPVSHLTLVVQTQFSANIYRDVHAATLDVDGQSVQCPVTDYTAERRGSAGSRRGRALANETLHIAVSRKLLRTLASARQADLQIRHVRLRLGRDQLAQFLAFQMRLDQP